MNETETDETEEETTEEWGGPYNMRGITSHTSFGPPPPKTHNVR